MNLKNIRALLVNPPTLSEIPEHLSGISYYDYLKIENRENLFLPGEGLGLQCIQAYVEEYNENCSIDIVNACIEEHTSLEQTLSCIKDKLPLDLIAFSGPVQVFQEVLFLANEIKKVQKEIKIIYGQFFASLCYKEILTNYSIFDYICIGHGEIPLSKIIHVLQDIESIAQVPSIAYRNDDNDIIVNQVDFCLKDIINVKPTRYRTEDVLKTGLCLSIFASRGCPYRCSFCVSGSLMKLAHDCETYALRNPIEVVDEIEYLYNAYKIKRLTIVDDTFAANNKDAKEQARIIAEEIIKRNIKIDLMLDTRIDCIEADLFRLLKEAGLKIAFIGIEAANNSSLKNYNKGYHADDILNKLKIMDQLGINVIPGMITFNPETDFDDLIINAELINRLSYKDVRLFSYEFIPYPGTTLTRELEERGFIEGQFPYYHITYKNKGIELVKKHYDKLLDEYIHFLFEKNTNPNFNICNFKKQDDAIFSLFYNYFIKLVLAIKNSREEEIHHLYEKYKSELMFHLQEINSYA